MIVRQRPKAWELPFIVRHSILLAIAPQILFVMLFSCAAVALEHRFPTPFRTWTVAPFTLLGTALSIFLGFRNNSCYDRWWEARRQLGSLVAETRSFARTLLALPGGDMPRRERTVRRTIAYVYALMAHLRGVPMAEEVARYSPASLRQTQNIPDALLRQLAVEISDMLADAETDTQLFRDLNDRLLAFTAIQVACERIRSTPTPFAYTLLLHRTAYAFCVLLPFSLVTTLGYATPIFCGVVAYAFFGLDALGDELEEPFGTSNNALPLDAMARTMEINLLEALGETALPAALLPVDHILK
jgi:putative membrane protein